MKKILIVVDMQNDFIDGALGSKEAQAIVPCVIKKIEAYKKQNKSVYFTKDTHQMDYFSTQEGRNLPIEHCILGTKGWELIDGIKKLAESCNADREEDIIFEKGTFGARELTMKLAMKKDEISEIELVGVCTDICVISNAIVLKTFMPEVKITVDANCCAGVTNESHRNALEAMKMCQIQVINA